MTRALLLLPLLAASFVGCASPEARHAQGVPLRAGALQGDELRLQGDWWVVKSEGAPLGPKPGGRAYIFQGRELLLGSDPARHFYRIDQTRKPHWIDIDDGHSPVVRGLYSLRGNSLTLRTAAAGSPRPTRLSGPVAPGDTHTVLQQQGR